MSETVTFLIGAVEFVARLKLNRYDSRLDRSENKLCI